MNFILNRDSNISSVYTCGIHGASHPIDVGTNIYIQYCYYNIVLQISRLNLPQSYATQILQEVILIKTFFGTVRI